MRAGSSPDKAGTCQYYQMVRVRQARQRGVTKVNQWLNPLKCGTGSNLVDMGRATVRDDVFGRRRRLRNQLLTLVGRPSPQYYGFGDGEAVAAKLGADPADRRMMNVGTVAWLPSPPGNRSGDGQVHRRLMIVQRGGGSVVVRGRESRPHGEGTQRVRRTRCGTSGGRW